MQRRLPQSTGAVLGYAIDGRLSREEVERIQADVGAAIDQHGSVRLLTRMDGMEGVEPAAVWQDLKMTPEHVRAVERLAVIGDRRWQAWTTTLADAFSDARYFEPDQEAQGWQWLVGASGVDRGAASTGD